MEYVIYSMKGCNWCVRAANLCKTKGITPKMIDIDEVEEAKLFILEDGHVTVPQVYTRSALNIMEHIGGFEALEDHFNKITH